MEEKESPQEKLNEVYEKLTDGDISIASALKQSNALNSEIIKRDSVDMVSRQTQQVFTHMDTITAQEQWHKDYPDYQEFVESGQAKDYMAKNPILIDETIAYFQYKADQGFEEGKAGNKGGTGTKKPTGDDADKKYLSRDEIESVQMETVLSMRDRRPTRQEPITLKEIENSQMTTLQKMRGKGE